MSSVFDGSLGAFQVGTILSTFLLGITATQAWNYYQNFPNDRRVYFWMVTGLLVMDWTHTAISCYTIYLWQVTNYGNIAFLANSPWSFAVDPAMTGIVAFVCQTFYAYRAYIVGKRSAILPIIIVFFSLVQLGFACGATGMIFKLQAFSKFQSWTYGVSVWLGAAAIADLLITGTLVYYLTRTKNSGVLASSSVLNRLIEMIISTNGLTAAVALIDAVLFGTLTTSYHVTANLCLIKLYFNSLLVSLNARVDLEKQLMGPRTFTHNLQGTNSQSGTQSLTTALGFGAADVIPAFVKTKPMNVLVQTTQMTMVTGEDTYCTKSIDFADLEKGGANASKDTFHQLATPPCSAHSSPHMPIRASGTPEVHVMVPLRREKNTEDADAMV